MDSGITSRNATASMYPAPSAKKYCKYRRGHSRRTTKYPPIKFPAAATNPNPAANPVRNANPCSMSDVVQRTACKLARNCHPERSEGSAFSVFLRALCELCVEIPISHSTTSSAVPEQNHIPLLHNVLFAF